MLRTLIAAAALTLTTGALAAQEVTLRVHHFMSERSTLHADLLVPLAERLAERSEGRMEMQVFGAMALGGRPGDLYDQAVDGAVDIILTLPGYTAGRFPRAEVFELPFLMDDNVAASAAFWDMIDETLQDGDFGETRVLAGWVHGPGVLHTEDPIATLEDLAGMELRGPTRLVTDLLGELGATPVGMPLPAIPENLSRGVISGAVVPWEITPSIRLSELVTHHTEVGTDAALYTAIFILAMNPDAYDALPDDLRALLDEETGKALSRAAGEIMLAADAVGRQIAVDNGNTIVTLDADEAARWASAATPVYDRWVAMAAEAGFDGAATIARAQELIAANR